MHGVSSPTFWKSHAPRSLAALALASVLALGIGCQADKSDGMSDTKPAMPKMAEKSLYERLGGEPALTAVVDDFVGRTAANPKVNFFRKGTAYEWKPSNEEVAMLKKHLVTFIAEATGGPKAYKGRDMKSSHAGMMITNAEFDALAGDLAASLDKFKVPAKEKGELMAIAASTRSAIVEK